MLLFSNLRNLNEIIETFYSIQFKIYIFTSSFETYYTPDFQKLVL